MKSLRIILPGRAHISRRAALESGTAVAPLPAMGSTSTGISHTEAETLQTGVAVLIGTGLAEMERGRTFRRSGRSAFAGGDTAPVRARPAGGAGRSAAQGACAVTELTV